MQVKGVGLARIGRGRENNEDVWLADDQLGLYVVADGMGGHLGGELAARIAVEAVAGEIRAEADLLQKVAAGETPGKKVEKLVREAFHRATRAVQKGGERRPGQQGMGCALTLLLVVGNEGVMGHVGHGRLYVCRGGAAIQVSRDQTVAEEYARAGIIKREQVERHSFANRLTQAVGRGEVVPEVLRFDLLPEDRIFLCTNGLSRYVGDSELLASQLGQEDLDGIPEELVRLVTEAGGSDDVTAVVVGVEHEPGLHTQAIAETRAKLEALDACFLFSDLSFARRALVLSYCKLRDHAVGGVVASEGDPLTGLVLLVQGALEVRRGKKKVGKLLAGDHFGVDAVLSSRRAKASVIASKGSQTLLLTADAMRSLSRLRPRLGVILLHRIAEHLRGALEEGPDPDDCPVHMIP